MEGGEEMKQLCPSCGAKLFGSFTNACRKEGNGDHYCPVCGRFWRAFLGVLAETIPSREPRELPAGLTYSS